jgi:hypothetical protein
MHEGTRRVTMTFGLVGLMSGLAIGAFTPFAPAAPYFERSAATICVPRIPFNYAHGFYPGYGVLGAELVHTSSSETGTYVCAIPDKTSMPQNTITEIKVYVEDANDNGTGSSNYDVAVHACAFSSSGGECSTDFERPTGVGYKTIILTTTELDALDAGETPYLWMTLPRTDYTGGGLGSSSIVGLVFTRGS